MALIREYDPITDYPALRTCFVELQAWEQSFEPGLPAPEEAADPYLAELFENCAESSGRIFLAEANGVVVGFVCVLAKEREIRFALGRAEHGARTRPQEHSRRPPRHRCRRR